MSTITRYVHIRTCGFEAKGGLTVKVVGDSENIGSVDVSHAVCSVKDNYCKKTGRILSSGRKSERVPLRSLPEYLKNLSHDTHRRHPDQCLPYVDYGYVMGQFLPKE